MEQNSYNFKQLYLIYHSAIQGEAAGMIISSQLSNGFIELPQNSTVLLRFTNVRIYIYRYASNVISTQYCVAGKCILCWKSSNFLCFLGLQSVKHKVCVL